MFWFSFEVSCQSSGVKLPANGALHYPAPFVQLHAILLHTNLLMGGDDPYTYCAYHARFEPTTKMPITIQALNTRQQRSFMQFLLPSLQCSRTVMAGGTYHPHTEQVSLAVHYNDALSTLDFLSAVITHFLYGCSTVLCTVSLSTTAKEGAGVPPFAILRSITT